MVRQRRERVRELGFELEPAGDEPLPLEDVQVCEPGRAGAGVTRVRVAVAPERAAVGRQNGSATRGDTSTPPSWHVAGGDALRERHQVRLEAPAGAREPVAAAAEAADDLVGDEEHAGVAADRARLGEIGRPGGEDAARADHRLAEKCGDPIGAGALDRLGERRRGVPRDVDDLAKRAFRAPR